MNTLLLLLLDSRAPAGTHHHSGQMEAAIGAGLVTGLADLEDFCRARLRTSARVAAAFTAASCRLQSEYPERAAVPAPGSSHAPRPDAASQWAELDAEFEARTPSEAMRGASRQLGRGLLRLLRSLRPGHDLVTPWARCGQPAPHHPLVLGPASAWPAAPRS
jgi:urease accessory protein